LCSTRWNRLSGKEKHHITKAWFVIRTADRNITIKYTERLAEAEIDLSVGTVGDVYDNALAECVIGLFKTEVINQIGPWKSMREVEWETLNRRTAQRNGLTAMQASPTG
jgi:transposase InsO family protein